MTKTSRPLAALLAAVMFAALWVPTLIAPTPAVAASQLA